MSGPILLDPTKFIRQRNLKATIVRLFSQRMTFDELMDCLVDVCVDLSAMHKPETRQHLAMKEVIKVLRQTKIDIDDIITGKKPL